MGESEEDRIGSASHARPRAIPSTPYLFSTDLLIPVKGTPCRRRRLKLSLSGFGKGLRMIATARVIMPRAMVRLSARALMGRSMQDQAVYMFFLAGANSIFSA